MHYVFDTSSIIILVEKCKLTNELLQLSGQEELIVPFRVKEEFYEKASTDDKASFEKIFKLATVSINEAILPYFNFVSTSGELWVMSHASNSEDCCCVIDEDFGRYLCNFLGIRFTGAIGIIKEMKKRGIINQSFIETIKKRIRQSGFYCTENLLAELDS